MSEFHPLQSHMTSASFTEHADIQIPRGTTFQKQVFLEYEFPAMFGHSYESIVTGFHSVPEFLIWARNNRQMAYLTIPIMLEYDRIVLVISSVTSNLSKPRELVLKKYFSPLLEEGSEYAVPIGLTAEETTLLTKSEYDYEIIFEHLGNRVGEYLNVNTFGFRHLAAYGQIFMTDAYSG